MSLLILGLVLFLAGHSLRVFWPAGRERLIQQAGPQRYKLLYTLYALGTFVLIVVGYGQARQDPVVLWAPLPGMAHLAVTLMLVALVMMVSAFLPRSAIARKLRHPTTLSVKVWSLAHLLANHTLADVLLFGSFLLWSVLVFRAARQRERLNPPVPVAASTSATVIALVGGVLVWALLLIGGHRALFGVSPLG
jgi:uncharacterized membrane protein